MPLLPHIVRSINRDHVFVAHHMFTLAPPEIVPAELRALLEDPATPLDQVLEYPATVRAMRYKVPVVVD